MSSISRPITEFCLDLYDKFNKTEEGQNILFSPTSISVALALIHLGTRNNTATQIEKVSTNETPWDASTWLAVLLMEMLGIAAWCVLRKEAWTQAQVLSWSATIPAICLYELPHAPVQIEECGVREEVVHHSWTLWSFPSLGSKFQAGVFSCGCCEIPGSVGAGRQAQSDRWVTLSQGRCVLLMRFPETSA